MRETQGKTGFTLAEVLIVIAIISVLAGVGFVAVMNYLRSMTKLQYDGYSREIFVAAQNHLSMAAEQGYLNFEDNEGDAFGKDSTNPGDKYFAVNVGSDGVTASSTTGDARNVFDLMLPIASIDETVRSGGSYIIRYNKDSARILDVYYWTESGRYAHKYTDSDEANFYDLTSNAGEGSKSDFTKYSDEKAVIGWYGGESGYGALDKGSKIEAPRITVKNAEKLTAEITNIVSKPNEKMSLIITGEYSKHSKVVSLSDSLPNWITPTSNGFIAILDDITTTGMHFKDLFCVDTDPDRLTPGEAITLQIVAYNNEELTNVAYSAVQRTNSLFADDTDEESAKISNIRHLENLNPVISNVSNDVAGVETIDGTTKRQAIQTKDLDWDEFVIAVGGAPAYVPVSTRLPNATEYILDYDGGKHIVQNIKIGSYPDEYQWAIEVDNEPGGMFGRLKHGKIENLRLLNFMIESDGDAGALAGTTDETDVDNVITYHIASIKGTIASKNGYAGGLIGKATGDCNITKSAAALFVNSSNKDAGGLIGSAGSGVAVNYCYSGGHTEEGKALYSDTEYNVKANNSAAGGLIGDFSGVAITNSYSTCSISGKIAGGFVGSGSGTYNNCYSTGLVNGTSAVGAFAGSLSGTATNCKYYEIINRIKTDDGAASAGSTVEGVTPGYLPPANGGTYVGVIPFDKDAEEYNKFVPAKSSEAIVYDSILKTYYPDGYCFPTVDQLKDPEADIDENYFVSVHYGDWPAPETWTFN